MKGRLSIFLAGAIALSLGAAGIGHAAAGRTQARQIVPPEHTVLVGNGLREVSQGSLLGFTPKYLDISVGDTVIFKDVDALEPHTVSFGPMSLLKQLIKDQFIPLPQKNGPPMIEANPKAFAPTMGHTYAGTGFANSGFMRKGQSWSLAFTKAGTYEYICLVHGLAMRGYVIVHPKQPRGTLYHVQAGDGPQAVSDPSNDTTNDAFYPLHLTIHAGDTVVWTGGFHTVSFGPAALLTQIQKGLFMPVPQKSGPPALALNPKVAFAVGGHSYDGSGFVSSGILALNVPPGYKGVPTYRLTFTKAGTYNYVCLLHPGMDGTITVLPAGA